jgi:hypothetical protein
MRNVNISASVSIRFAISLIVMLTIMLSWTVVAYAQQMSSDKQYGSPTAAGESAIAGSGGSDATGSWHATGGSDATGSWHATGGSDATGSWHATDGPDATGSAGMTGVLPSTGGPLLQLAALGTLALASTGLFMLQLHSRR